MFSNERIIVEVRIRRVDSIDFSQLPGTQAFVFIQTPDAFQQSLTPQHFMQASDTTVKIIRCVEERRVAVGDGDVLLH